MEKTKKYKKVWKNMGKVVIKPDKVFKKIVKKVDFLRPSSG